MSTSGNECSMPTAESVQVSVDSLSVALSDGRTITAPLAWYPRLLHGSAKERGNWRLIARGQGIHWKDLDEDISVEGLLAGRASGESQASFKKWLEARTPRSARRATTRRRASRTP